MEEDKKYNSLIKIILAVVVTFIITFCGTILLYYHYLSKQGAIVQEYDSSKDISEYLDAVRTKLENEYKGEIDDEKLKEAAVKGYVEGLGDEYTEYLTESEWDTLNSELSDFVGIGVYLAENKNTKETVIVGVVNDETPAAKAGLQAGDIIIEVNLEDVSTMGSNYISSKVKGIEGSSVKIKVLRGEEKLTFDVVREKIKMYEIKYEMLENNIGYIDFDSFTDTSYEEFENAYNELKKQGAKSLIVDIRDNGGGYVDSALKIADLFVEKNQPLLITEDKDGARVTQSSKTGKTIDVPVVLLVNEYSASASEILTGILKDYKIATIVGTKTYGKGVMQTIFPNVYKGALKITTAEYFSPNGNKINKIGIDPDVEVKLEIDSQTKLTKENDNQLKKAIELLK